MANTLFIFLIGVFLCLRIYGYFYEIKRFDTEINSYKIDFSQPAITDGIKVTTKADFETLREYHYNQIYFYRIGL